MSKRILLVEDQADNRKIIRDVLAGTDYEITEAEDGEQAPPARGEGDRASHLKTSRNRSAYADRGYCGSAAADI